MISKQELAQTLGRLLQGCLYIGDFLRKKEEVRQIAHNAGGTLDSYEQEGTNFDVRISLVNGWGSDALFSRKFPLKNIAMAAE